MREFSHLEDDRARMVDIGDKPTSNRRAVAEGTLSIRPETGAAIEEGAVAKGNVLGVARIAGIQAAKRTAEAIPMCHQIPLTSVDIAFEVEEDRVTARAVVEATARTGVEMEALGAVSGALLTVWDMIKAVEKDETGAYPSTSIDDVRVLEKVKSEP